MKPPATSATLLRENFSQISVQGPATSIATSLPRRLSGVVAGPVSATPSMCVWVGSCEPDPRIEDGEQDVGDQHADERQHAEQQDDRAREIHVLHWSARAAAAGPSSAG